MKRILILLILVISSLTLCFMACSGEKNKDNERGQIIENNIDNFKPGNNELPLVEIG